MADRKINLLNPHRTRRVEAALYRDLLGISAIPLLGSAVASVLVGIVLWSPENGLIVIGWVMLVYAAIAIRSWLAVHSRKILITSGYERTDAYRYALSVGISGVAWGVGGIFVVDASPLATAFTVIAFQAMVMGGVVTLSVFLPAFLAFAVPAIVPMIVALALDGGRNDIVLAIFNSILLGLTSGVARRINRSLRQTWELTFEKEDLVAALIEARDGMTVLADTDGLTGLANRRRFDQALETEFTRARRSKAPLSLIILDVDFFKNYNDSYGHVAGDECLRRVSAVLKDSLNRAADIPARYGGEEFAAILPETDYRGAVAVAERVRSDIATLAIPHRDSAAADHVTVSLGVVTYDCSAINSPHELVLMADEQLYRAKAEGRNRLTCRNRDSSGRDM